MENQGRATTIVAAVTLMLIFVAFAYHLTPIKQEAQASAVKMAKGWMEHSVQRYRQAWQIKGQPKTLSMDGFQLIMTQGGLVSPFLASGELDCDYWLAVHYPQRKIMASNLLQIRGRVKSNNYICNYTYENGYKVVVNSDGIHLKLTVQMLTE